MNLGNAVKFIRVMNSVAAGTGDTQTSSAVDTAGFDGCLFAVHLGAITATAVTTVKAQQSSDDGATDAYADLAGSAQTPADTDDNKIVLIDIFRPQERYLKALVVRATANVVIDGIDAILYNADVKPTVQDATTVFGLETFASPAEGTA